MSNMWVVSFDTENGAEVMLTALGDWQRQKLIKVDDAATLVRRADGKVKIKHADNLVGKGALGGAFWGALIGLVFLNPVAGAAVGAGVGTMIGRRKGKKQAEAGIDPKFVKEVSENIKPGSSALFAYTQQGVAEKLLPQLSQYHGKLIQSSLTPEDDEAIREAFGAEEMQTADMTNQ
jgi:uncharacterized membrane protein